MSLVDVLAGWEAEAVDDSHLGVAVDRVVHGLPHSHVVEWWSVDVELIRHDVWVRAGDNLEARVLELRHGVRRRDLRPVNIACLYSGQTWGRRGRRQDPQLVQLGLPLAVVRVRCQLHSLAVYVISNFEGT